MKYKLGILGGMGPYATQEIFRRIILNTKVTKDQDGIEIIIYNNSKIPDRTDFIVNKKVSPLPEILNSLSLISSCGVDYIIIACNTAHYFYNQINENFKDKFIDLVKISRNYLQLHHSKSNVIVLSTKGTITGKIFERIDENTLNISYPNLMEQEILMKIIYEIKRSPSQLLTHQDLFISVLDEINKRERNVVFLIACTELSLLVDKIQGKIYNYIDTMDLLVTYSILKLGYNAQNSSILNKIMVLTENEK